MLQMLLNICYLIPFPPRVILQAIKGKLLRATHDKVNEVSTACQAAQDQKVGQNTEKTGQVDVVILSALLLLQDCLLANTEGQIYGI